MSVSHTFFFMYICFRCKNNFVNNDKSFEIFRVRLLCRMSPAVFSWKELPKWQFSPSTPIFYFTPLHFILSFVPLFTSYINYFIFIYFIYIKTHTHIFFSLSRPSSDSSSSPSKPAVSDHHRSRNIFRRYILLADLIDRFLYFISGASELLAPTVTPSRATPFLHHHCRDHHHLSSSLSRR